MTLERLAELRRFYAHLDPPEGLELIAEIDRLTALVHELTVTRLEHLPNGDPAMTLIDPDPDRGSHADEPSFECSLLCQLAEDEGNPDDH